jgi:uncharacterized protein (TIGR01777 family)
MHVLITGGSGFIGRALARELLADGHRVTVLTRNATRTRARLPEAAGVVETLAEASAVDAVVNLAGENLAEGRWTPTRKQALRDSRLDTTRTLLAWMEAQPRRPGVLVSGSAVGWYGPRGDETLGEDAAPGEDFAAQLCCDWEAEAVKAEALGVRVCRIRTGLVLDPEGGALAKMLLPFRLGLGGPLGDGRQWMSWIVRADLVALIRWLLGNQGAQGAYNATAPNPVTNAEFARTLGHALHRPALLPAPGFALRLLFGEMAELLLTGQRVLPARATAQGFQFRYPELAPAFAAMFG